MKDEILLKIIYLKEKSEIEKLNKLVEFEREDFDFSNLWCDSLIIVDE